MKSDEEIRKLLKEFTKSPIMVMVAEVLAVNADQTVDVLPVGGVELFDVRLKAAVDGDEEGVYAVPEIGSSVLVGLVGNDKNTAFVLKCSKVAKLVIKVKNLDFEATESGFVFNSGSFGGLIKIEELKTQLEKINQSLQALLDGFANWTPVAQDGGAALKTVMSALLAGKQVGDFSNIENDKVKH